MDLKKRFKDAVYIGLGLFLIAILMLRADVTDTLDVMSGIDLTLLLLVIGLYFFNTSCKVLRWYGLVKGMGGKRRGFILLPIFLSSLALNNSTPGKVGGEPVRALMLKEHTGNRASLGIATIFAEKSLDILTILSFSVVGIIYMISVLGLQDVKGMALAILIGGPIIVIVILLVSSSRFAGKATTINRSISLRLVKGDRSSRVFRLSVKVSEFTKRFHASFRAIRKQKRIGTGIVMLTLAIWTNEALRFYIILHALPGDLSITFLGALAAVAVANILGFILPFGSGNVIGSASIIELLSGNELLATAASLIMMMTSLWISLPMGIISLFFLRSRKESHLLDGK